jgi:hypothetical protein
MKWEITTNLLEEKYLIIHKINFESIFPWHRKYYGKYVKETNYFKISYCYDYITREDINIDSLCIYSNMIFYKMIRQGQLNMERRSYQIILRGRVDEYMIIPDFL